MRMKANFFTKSFISIMLSIHSKAISRKSMIIELLVLIDGIIAII